MKKKLALICAMVMFIMSFAQSAGAINVIMNSSFVNFYDQEPVVVNGTTLVPIRTIAEMLGLEVTWDDPTDTVVLKKDNFYIELVIGSTVAKTSSGEKTLLTAPSIINSRTMVPLRFIAEELGLTVSWNDKYQRVVIAGQVDTTTVVVPEPKVEETTDINGDVVVEENNNVTEVDQIVTEEETEVVEEVVLTTIEAQSSVVVLELPLTFYAEDPDAEESFAYRSLDAFDAQHKYDWENVVARYESYVDESATNGIVFVVQEFQPYEGEEYDISIINDEYPERPENPVDMRELFGLAQEYIKQRICEDREVEVPENLEEMTDEEFIAYLGFESQEEYNEFMEGYDIREIMTELPEYQDYLIYQEEYNEYSLQVNTLNAARDYAARMFSSVYSNLSDEQWITFFTSYFNSDQEVRYEGVEILDVNEHKVIHATIYAEDPDDEQGVYEYYHYVDNDSLVTIFGGTLLGSEASPEAADCLANMNIQ